MDVLPHHKAIFRHACDVLGTEAKVAVCSFGKEKEPFHIGTWQNAPRKGVSAFTTIGLSDRIPNQRAKVRYELASACNVRSSKFSDVLSYAAHLIVAKPKRAAEGELFQKIVSTRYASSEACHFLLTETALLGFEMPPLAIAKYETRWIYAVPITSEELARVEGGDTAALVQTLGEMRPKTKLFDIDRVSKRQK